MDPRAFQASTAFRGITVLLGLVYLLAGGLKLAGAQMMVESFQSWGYSASFMYLVGALEVVAAVMVVTSRFRFVGAGLIFMLMLGAAITHTNAGEWMAVSAPVVMMALSGLVLWTERAVGGPRELHA